MMENLLRLHNVPLLESNKADKWFKRLMHYWVLCGGQLVMCQRGKKRKNVMPTVLPAGNAEARSKSAKALASRRKRHRLNAPHTRTMDE